MLPFGQMAEIRTLLCVAVIRRFHLRWGLRRKKHILPAIWVTTEGHSKLF